MDILIKKNLSKILFLFTLAISSMALAGRNQTDSEAAVERVPAELKTATEQLVRCFNEGNIEGLQKLIDIRAVAYRAAKLVTDKQKERDEFVAGFASKGTSIASTLINSVQNAGGNVKLLKYVKRCREIRPLTRFYLGDAGFDYLEFVLEQKGNGEYRVVDWYPLTTGQLYSVSVGAISKMLVDPNPGMLWSLLGVKKVDQAVLHKIQNMEALMQSGKYSEAYDVFDELPENIRNSRIFLNIGMNIANKLENEKLYAQLLADLARFHANDPSAAFMLLDHYYYQGDFKKALHSIDAIEKRVGTDGVIQALRANSYLELNEYEKAIQYAQSATTLEPDLENNYFSLALGYVGSGKHAEAVKVYQTLETRFGYQFSPENFNKDQRFSAFRDSKEFSAWLKN